MKLPRNRFAAGNQLIVRKGLRNLNRQSLLFDELLNHVPVTRHRAAQGHIRQEFKLKKGDLPIQFTDRRPSTLLDHCHRTTRTMNLRRMSNRQAARSEQQHRDLEEGLFHEVIVALEIRECDLRSHPSLGPLHAPTN